MKKLWTLLFVVISTSSCARKEPYIHKEYHKNGKLKYEFIVKGGGSKSIRKYDEGGKLKNGIYKERPFEYTYKNGKAIALNEYYENGVLKSEAIVKNHEVITIKEYDKDGQPKNGIYKEIHMPGYYNEIPYRNGKRHGLWKGYEKDALVVELNYIDGEREYKKAFRENGKVMYIVYYNKYENGEKETRKDFDKDGVLESMRITDERVKIFRRYHKNGKILIEYIGKKFKDYYEDGSLQATGEYNENGKHGIFERFNKNGDLMSERIYIDGKLLYLHFFDKNGYVTHSGDQELSK